MTPPARYPPKYSIDPGTLRETVSNRESAASYIDTLKATGEEGDAERVSWLRMIGRLAEAEELGWQMLIDRGGADASRTVAEPLPFVAVTAALRLAHVLQWREDFNKAESLFLSALRTAETAHLTQDESSPIADIISAFAWQHLGKLRYDQQRYSDSLTCFCRAWDIRVRLDSPADELESTRLAMAAASARLNTAG